MKKKKRVVMCMDCALARISMRGNNPAISECSIHGLNVAEAKKICRDFKDKPHDMDR